jgi:hypothetical protein
MPSAFSVDLISDLNLSAGDEIDWEGKPTSLFCAIAGGLSNDLDVVKNTLDHLSSYYRGIMYIDGSTEHTNMQEYESRVERLREICAPMTNVVYMHNHVVILNSVAFVACNGWFHNRYTTVDIQDRIKMEDYRLEDVAYLSKSIRSLQVHHDARKIVVITSSVPSENFLFNRSEQVTGVEPGMALMMDTENKIDAWLYGGTDISTDQMSGNIRFVNNPCRPGQPYWPKHVLV